MKSHEFTYLRLYLQNEDARVKLLNAAEKQTDR